MEDSFSMDWGRDKGWFGDDSSMFNLLCALFLLILHQLLLRSSGIRFQRLGTPGLEPTCEQPSAKSSLSGNPVWPNGWVMTGEGLMPANP